MSELKHITQVRLRSLNHIAKPIINRSNSTHTSTRLKKSCIYRRAYFCLLMMLQTLSIILMSPSCIAKTGLFFNASTSGHVITINTTVSNKTYSYAGIQLTTPGYSLTRACSDPSCQCTPLPNGLCKFTRRINTSLSQKISITGPAGSFNFFLCLNTYGHLTCQNQFGHQINQPALTRRAYITNNNGGPGTFVSVCNVDSDGSLSGCTDAGFSGSFDMPQQIVINPTNTVAYIANEGNNTIFKCTINAMDGTFSACTNTLGTGFVGPTGIALNYNATQPVAYITNQNAVGTGHISKCDITINNDLTNCVSTASSLPSAVSLVGIVVDNSGDYIYTTDFQNQNTYRCTINADGTLNDCILSGPDQNFHLPQGIALTPDASTAYIVNQTIPGSISICPINHNGLFNTCSSYASALFSGTPTGITLNDSSSIAYIVAQGNNAVIKCTFTNGSISLCNDAGATGLNSPAWVALAY